MSSSKRARSSSISPPPKRARHENESANTVALNFHHPPIPESGGSIRHIVASHEIFLNVLGFLPAEDLTRVEGVSREWRNMALDSHLWRNLYLARYPGSSARTLVTDVDPATLLGSSSSRTESGESRKTAPVSASVSTSRADHDAAETSRTRICSGSKPGSALVVEGSERKPPEVSPVRDLVNLEPLPGRESKRDAADWKMMYKIGSNWSTGNASVESLSPTSTPRARSRPPPPSSPSQTQFNSINTSRPPISALSDGLIALSPDFIFTADPSSPLLQVHLSSSTSRSRNRSASGDLDAPVALIPPPPGWSSPSHPEVITSMAVDGYQPVHCGGRSHPVRLAVFYRSGGYAVVQLQLRSSNLQDEDAQASEVPSVTWSRLSIFTSNPHRRRSRRLHVPDPSDHVTLSTFFYPVLISCTNRFFLSIYRVASKGSPTLLQTMHSAVSCHPATLSILPVAPVVDTTMTEDTWSVRGEDEPATDLHYRATLAYSSPLYPKSWTVAVQEMNISIPLSPTSKAHGQVAAGECWQVARKVWHGGWSERRWPFRAKGEIVGVKGDQAVDIGVDERWCVLAGEGGEIQVYALPTTEDSSRPRNVVRFGTLERRSRSPPSIHHSQTLLAHSSAITSLSLSHGRCVSASRDGRVLVWELDESVAANEAAEKEEEEMMGRLRNVTEGKMEVRFVEVKDVGGVRGDGRGSMNTFEGESSSNSIAEESQSSIRALRRQILPRPPAPHPLSVAGIIREYNLNVSSSAVVEGFKSASSINIPTSSIRNITFNQDTIAGLIKIEDDTTTSEDGLEEIPEKFRVAAESTSAAAAAPGTLTNSFVRIWKFDV